MPGSEGVCLKFGMTFILLHKYLYNECKSSLASKIDWASFCSGR